jgi:hypothetical protein
LVFNDVNVRNLKNRTACIHSTVLHDESYAIFYNRLIAAADSAVQKFTNLGRRELLRDKLQKIRRKRIIMDVDSFDCLIASY